MPEQNITFTAEELEYIAELVNERWRNLTALSDKITCLLEGEDEQPDNN